MATTIVGLKIREARRGLGMSQSDLAQRMGISPAYLNLIEFSKRRISGKLLRKAAEALGLQLPELDGAAERRLLSELHEIAADPNLHASGLDAELLQGFVGRFPDWAAALADIYRSHRADRDLAAALSDRLTHDPYLSDIVHQMLTHISAIRSVSEILDEVPEIEAAQRARFHTVLATESGRLTDVAQALAGYFDDAHAPERAATPVEEIETFLIAHDNHFEAIEAAADQLRAEHDGMDAVAAGALDEPIGSVLRDDADGLSAVAHRHLTALLETYATDALLMPAGAFRVSAEQCRYDLEVLSATWQVGIERVCRRLTAIRGHSDDAPRFAYLCANAAGHTIDRRPRSDLHLPRYGSACPLWSIYRAFASPDAVIRQVAQFPDGRKMLFVARARRAGQAGFDRPVDYVSDMIVVSAEGAAQTVYGDGIDFGTRGKAEPVGLNCRICPREGCRQRTDDPLVGRPHE